MKKKSGKKKYGWLLMLVPLLALSGCGKTVKASLKVGTCALEVPQAAYDDTKDNADTMKKLVTPTEPSK